MWKPYSDRLQPELHTHLKHSKILSEHQKKETSFVLLHFWMLDVEEQSSNLESFTLYGTASVAGAPRFMAHDEALNLPAATQRLGKTCEKLEFWQLFTGDWDSSCDATILTKTFGSILVFHVFFCILRSKCSVSTNLALDRTVLAWTYDLPFPWLSPCSWFPTQFHTFFLESSWD